jgi:hypothetical protein
MIIIAYLCNVEAPAAHHIQEVAPMKQWCSMTLVTALGDSGRSLFVLRDEHTPYWGRALFPELRFWAKLVTGQTNEQGPQSYACWWHANNIVGCGYLLFTYFMNPELFLMGFVSIIGLMLGGLLVTEYQCQRANHTQRYSTYEPILRP